MSDCHSKRKKKTERTKPVGLYIPYSPLEALHAGTVDDDSRGFLTFLLSPWFAYFREAEFWHERRLLDLRLRVVCRPARTTSNRIRHVS
jgi:hypothetical protein